ncbi:hypothetical protein SNS2_2714 [Streptomyces netropsis]|nr:hypothetical protein SNS2_2714 [Streptomyces netropsis]
MPEGGGGYFAAMMISPWVFAVVGKKVIRTDDWRPSLGLSAGALAGVVITLSTGMTAGFWVEVLILLALGAGIPLLLWTKGDGRR